MILMRIELDNKESEKLIIFLKLQFLNYQIEKQNLNTCNGSKMISDLIHG